jgi:small subunit ribosomal protein S16
MLKIRLQKVGRKHEPVFRLVLTDSKNSTKSGKFLEILGNYDSRNGEKATFDAERITKLIANGAQLSDTVHNLLITKKIISGKKVNALPKKKAIVSEKPAEAVVESAPAATEPAVASEEAPVEATEEVAETVETPVA